MCGKLILFLFLFFLTGKSTFMSLVDSKNWIGSTTITTNQAHTMNRPTVVNSAAAMPFVQQTTTPTTRRNTGGRRPQKSTGVSIFLKISLFPKKLSS